MFLQGTYVVLLSPPSPPPIIRISHLVSGRVQHVDRGRSNLPSARIGQDQAGSAMRKIPRTERIMRGKSS